MQNKYHLLSIDDHDNSSELIDFEKFNDKPEKVVLDPNPSNNINVNNNHAKLSSHDMADEDNASDDFPFMPDNDLDIIENSYAFTSGFPYEMDCISKQPSHGSADFSLEEEYMDELKKQNTLIDSGENINIINDFNSTKPQESKLLTMSELPPKSLTKSSKNRPSLQTLKITWKKIKNLRVFVNPNTLEIMERSIFEERPQTEDGKYANFTKLNTLKIQCHKKHVSFYSMTNLKTIKIWIDSNENVITDFSSKPNGAELLELAFFSQKSINSVEENTEYIEKENSNNNNHFTQKNENEISAREIQKIYVPYDKKTLEIIENPDFDSLFKAIDSEKVMLMQSYSLNKCRAKANLQPYSTQELLLKKIWVNQDYSLIDYYQNGRPENTISCFIREIPRETINQSQKTSKKKSIITFNNIKNIKIFVDPKTHEIIERTDFKKVPRSKEGKNTEFVSIYTLHVRRVGAKLPGIKMEALKQVKIWIDEDENIIQDFKSHKPNETKLVAIGTLSRKSLSSLNKESSSNALAQDSSLKKTHKQDNSIISSKTKNTTAENSHGFFSKKTHQNKPIMSSNQNSKTLKNIHYIEPKEKKDPKKSKKKNSLNHITPPL